MAVELADVSEEALQLERARDGSQEALAWLYQQHHEHLRKILRARGADEADTEDILGELWAQCIPGDATREPLLGKYKGVCSLRNWLATVATRRWYDLLRRRKFYGDPPKDDRETSFFERQPAPASSPLDTALARLLQNVLKQSLVECGFESSLMLRLVYLHGLTQREVARMWGWNEVKVSRHLSAAMDRIKREATRDLRRRDPDLRLGWDDLMELCQNTEAVL